ncbi:MAG: DUF3990 domain-containing protein [Endomicrobium sp.]|jgi:hypothetical protein|nr:DUF3990 domain-containing protein [Endomicrobium sp.]
MIVYHGSNIEIETIDLSKCKPHKDFGQGFYTTALKEQAIEMAKRTCKRYGGGKACVSKFYFDDALLKSKQLDSIVFKKTNKEWAFFILNNRYPKKLSNIKNKYDIVMGPVANDDIDLSFNQFAAGFLTMNELLQRLRYKKLNNQISFHSKRAISFLQKKEVFYV